MNYSSLQRKLCKCGCNMMPTISYEGYYHQHAPKEVLDRLEVKQKRKNAVKKDLTKLRVVEVESDDNRQMVEKYRTKSELLREADRLFSLFIRNRDADKNGNVACVCCGKIYNVEDHLNSCERIIQNMHFIKREVYSLRFDEDNCSAGCCYCNQDMNFNPKGIAYRQYKERLVADLGEDAVAEMELAHRKINRIEESQLKVIIEHYGNKV